MKTVHIEHWVSGWDEKLIYEKLKDGEEYKRHAPEHVKSVTLEPTDDVNVMISHWELYFRNGLLEWSERDYYDDDNWALRFEQIDGDFEEFHGCWQVHSDSRNADSVLVTFTATFDFGVPSVESMVEPVAAKLLEQSISRVVSELFERSAA